MSVRVGVREIELRLAQSITAENVRAFIEDRDSAATRRRLWVAYSLRLAQQAVDGSSLRAAADTFSLALHNLQIPGRLDASVRMTYAEASLRLADEFSEKPNPWLASVSGYYRNRKRFGIEPVWRRVFGLDRTDIFTSFDQIRGALNYQDFVPNPPPTSTPVPRSEVPDEDLQIPLVERQSKLRVREVEIDNFRGIGRRTKLDFRDSDGHAVSCLISGDNGTGKSTIVSAIEFACQARIGQRVAHSATGLPYPVNVASGSTAARVWLSLSDDSVRSRTLSLADNQARSSGGPVEKEFRLAPMSLQRSDIVRFLSAAPQERGKLFLEHFGAVTSLGGPQSGELTAIREQLTREKKRRRDLLSGLAEQAGFAEVPVTCEDLEMLKQVLFFNGMTQRRWERRYGRPVPEAAIEISRTYDELSASIKRLTDHARRLQALASQEPNVTRVRRLGVLLGDISGPMTEALHQITAAKWVKGISIEFGELSAMSIELRVILSNGIVLAPESIFSEGLQDLVAVLFFLEIAQSAAARGQARILILDDVLQSVDSGIRVNLLEYVLKRFSSWQLFVTVHDRLWREQLVNLMRRHSHRFVEREVRRWDFDDGPDLRVASSNDLDALLAALQVGSTSMIVAETGRLLEKVSNVLSYTLPISVTRRSDDRYDLGSLWPGVLKKLRKTTLRSTALEVDRWLVLRNLLGAHYNSWATSLPQSDADSFAAAVIDLHRAVYCGDCSHWVRSDAFGSRWSCRCGRTEVGAELA